MTEYEIQIVEEIDGFKERFEAVERLFAEMTQLALAKNPLNDAAGIELALLLKLMVSRQMHHCWTIGRVIENIQVAFALHGVYFKEPS